jgi:hypothetical protein
MAWHASTELEGDIVIDTETAQNDETMMGAQNQGPRSRTEHEHGAHAVQCTDEIKDGQPYGRV